MRAPAGNDLVRWKRVCRANVAADDNVEMVEHDGHGSQLPTADASGFPELSQSSFGVSCGELDWRALHGVTRRRFQAGHVFVIGSTGQLVWDARLLFWIRRPVFP